MANVCAISFISFQPLLAVAGPKEGAAIERSSSQEIGEPDSRNAWQRVGDNMVRVKREKYHRLKKRLSGLEGDREALIQKNKEQLGKKDKEISSLQEDLKKLQEENKKLAKQIEDDRLREEFRAHCQETLEKYKAEVDNYKGALVTDYLSRKKEFESMVTNAIDQFQKISLGGEAGRTIAEGAKSLKRKNDIIAAVLREALGLSENKEASIKDSIEEYWSKECREPLLNPAFKYVPMLNLKKELEDAGSDTGQPAGVSQRGSLTHGVVFSDELQITIGGGNDGRPVYDLLPGWVLFNKDNRKVECHWFNRDAGGISLKLADGEDNTSLSIRQVRKLKCNRKKIWTYQANVSADGNSRVHARFSREYDEEEEVPGEEQEALIFQEAFGKFDELEVALDLSMKVNDPGVMIAANHLAGTNTVRETLEPKSFEETELDKDVQEMKAVYQAMMFNLYRMDDSEPTTLTAKFDQIMKKESIKDRHCYIVNINTAEWQRAQDYGFKLKGFDEEGNVLLVRNGALLDEGFKTENILVIDQLNERKDTYEEDED